MAGGGLSCREIQKTAGLQRVVHDMPCRDLKKSLVDQLQAQKIPVEIRDEPKGLIKAGPFYSQPLPTDPYQRVEEDYLLEVACLDEISTRISLKSRIRVQGQGRQWSDITDPAQKTPYENRFLDRLTVR
jgi:hypothetical protein